jgi:hypothetical protein
MIEFFTVIGMFILAIVIISGFKTSWTFKNIEEGAVWSLLKAVVVTVCLFFMFDRAYASEVQYFKYTELFAGVDYTKKISPQCYEGGVDDRLTSNIGFRQHLVTYSKVDVIGQYTHHSCVIGSDNRQYDAIGIHAVYRWGGKD